MRHVSKALSVMPGVKFVKVGFQRVCPSGKRAHIWHGPSLTPSCPVSEDLLAVIERTALRGGVRWKSVTLDHLLPEDSFCPTGSLGDRISSPGLPAYPARFVHLPSSCLSRLGPFGVSGGVHQPQILPTLWSGANRAQSLRSLET